MNNLMRKVLLRRSVYGFSANLLRDEDLMAILEEGKLLSNAENNQVWHFTAIQNKDIIRKIYSLSQDALDNKEQKGNASALMSLRRGAELLLNMPMLLVISGCDVKYADDAADTLFGSMMLAADKHGVSSCWLGDLSEILAEEGEKMKVLLQIPGSYMPLCIGAFGYKQQHGIAKVTTVDSIVNIIR